MDRQTKSIDLFSFSWFEMHLGFCRICTHIQHYVLAYSTMYSRTSLSVFVIWKFSNISQTCFLVWLSYDVVSIYTITYLTQSHCLICSIWLVIFSNIAFTISKYENHLSHLKMKFINALLTLLLNYRYMSDKTGVWIRNTGEHHILFHLYLSC